MDTLVDQVLSGSTTSTSRLETKHLPNINCFARNRVPNLNLVNQPIHHSLRNLEEQAQRLHIISHVQVILLHTIKMEQLISTCRFSKQHNLPITKGLIAFHNVPRETILAKLETSRQSELAPIVSTAVILGLTLVLFSHTKVKPIELFFAAELLMCHVFMFRNLCRKLEELRIVEEIMTMVDTPLPHTS
jgi:hypothetical protein